MEQTKWYAESAMQDYLWEHTTAERESVDTVLTSDQRRR